MKRKYPEIEKIVRENLKAQELTERAQTDSVDRAADATAQMLAEFSDYALQDKKTDYTHNLFYAIGKWIYLIDALDDYDKDKAKGAYNPFILAYNAECRKALLEGKYAEEVAFIFRSVFFDIKESLAQIPFRFNTDLSDNILLRGLPAVTKRVMEGNTCGGKCHKKSQKKNTKRDE